MTTIPLAVPNLAGREAEFLRECVDSTFVSTVGPFVTRFEAMVAEACGAPRAVATSAGTTALHAALHVLGVGHGDLVILPSLTFVASANAIAHCGATPWLLDVDQTSWTLDPDLLARELRENTERTPQGLRHRPTGQRVAALLPVFTLGLPADMDRLSALAREAGLPVVVDAAAALGATYRGRPIGTIDADLMAFSFNGNKTVTAGGGGAVAGRDDALCDRVRHVTTTARVGSEYDHDEVGFNYRMTNLQAAVGCAQMENLTVFVERKLHVRRRYDAAFSGTPGLAPFPAPPWGHGSAWLSGFLLEEGDPDLLRAHLRAAGIDARPFWKPMHMLRPYQDAPRSSQPVAEGLWRRIVTLPSSTNLTEAEIDHVIAAVLSGLEGCR